MIKFNWKLIVLKTDNNPEKILKIISHLVTRRKVPFRTVKDYWLYSTDWRGDSFLVRPELFLSGCMGYDYKYILQYLELASYRNYQNYKILKQIRLDYLACWKEVELNPLLKVINGQIAFLFEEELKHGNRI